MQYPGTGTDMLIVDQLVKEVELDAETSYGTNTMGWLMLSSTNPKGFVGFISAATPSELIDEDIAKYMGVVLGIFKGIDDVEMIFTRFLTDFMMAHMLMESENGTSRLFHYTAKDFFFTCLLTRVYNDDGGASQDYLAEGWIADGQNAETLARITKEYTRKIQARSADNDTRRQ